MAGDSGAAILASVNRRPAQSRVASGHRSGLPTTRCERPRTSVSGAIILIFLSTASLAWRPRVHQGLAQMGRVHLRKKKGVVPGDLNSWAIELVRELSNGGRLPLSYEMDARDAENAESRRHRGVMKLVARQAPSHFSIRS